MHKIAMAAALFLLVPIGVGHAQGPKLDCQGIPCGHLPPPGQCRAWLPGVPAGQQPPPGVCRRIERAAPRRHG
jgi:hypothetical protein